MNRLKVKAYTMPTALLLSSTKQNKKRKKERKEGKKKEKKNKPGVAVLNLVKADFRARSIVRYKVDHYIVIKG